MTDSGSRGIPGHVQPLRARDPRQLGTYLLTARLGEGGQGVVYLGTRPDGAKVAIKLLRAEFADDEGARSRFVREVATAERVSGPFTAKVLDADVAGDRPYVVSEFIDAPSLQDMIARNGPMPPMDLERLAVGTASALAAIHSAGVVHRDFKPGNVLWAPAGPKVIDFGIARALDATATLSSNVVGSPAYMAPEQFAPPDDRPAGTPADIFAWASTIAFATTSRAPFGSDDIPRIMHRILYAEPDLRGVPLPLLDLLRSCLAKDPSVRPSARQIVARLRNEPDVTRAMPGARITFETPTVAQPQPDQQTDQRPGIVSTNGDGPRRKRMVPAAIAAVLTVALVGTVAYVAYANRERSGFGANAGPSASATSPQASDDPTSPEPSKPETPKPPVRPQAGAAFPDAKAVLETALDSKLSLVDYTTYEGGKKKYVWDASRGEYVADPRFQQFTQTSYSPDGKWATGTHSMVDKNADGYLYIVDRTSADPARIVKPPVVSGKAQKNVRLMTGQWSPDSRQLVVPVYYLTDVKTFKDYEDLGLLFIELGKEDQARFVRKQFRSTWNYTPDGDRLMTNGTASPNLFEFPDIEFTDLRGTVETSIPDAGWLRNTNPVFSPDGSKVVTVCDASKDKTVNYACVWDIDSKRRIAKVPFGTPYKDAFSGLVSWWDDDNLLVEGQKSQSHEKEAVIVDFEGHVERTLISRLDSIIPTFAYITGQ